MRFVFAFCFWNIHNYISFKIACDSQHYGENCAKECGCGAGSEKCDPVSGCVCKQGWAGEKCDVDQDECKAATSPCTAANTKCVNIPGSYQCPCKDGYAEVNNICKGLCRVRLAYMCRSE